MLNETYLLFRALKEAGIQIPQKNKRLTSPGWTSGDCLRVRLDAAGNVATVESIDDREWVGLWTVMDGKQNSFPVIRLKKSILAVPADDKCWSDFGFDSDGRRQSQRISSNQDHLQILQKTLKETSIQPDTSFWARLSKKAEELMVSSEAQRDQQYAALPEFATRFLAAVKNPAELLQQIAERSISGIRDARLDCLDVVESLLVGRPPKKGKKQTITIQLVFDVSDDRRFPHALYSSEMRDYVSNVLPQNRAQPKRRKQNTGACAYTGKIADLENDTFPQVFLPVLNKCFPLVSMFSFAKCNMRYGLTDAQVIPVGKELAMRMKEALEYIVAPERRGKTWRGVAAGKFKMRNGRKVEEKDLLIVYVDGRPIIDANVADFFGRDEAQIEKQFEADAKAVCIALDGINKERPGSKMCVFLLRKVSEGQAKILKADIIAVDALLESAERWQKAVTDNLPDIRTPRIPSREKGKLWAQGNITTPYPDDVVRLLAKQWIRDGSSPVVNGKSQKAYHEVEGVGLGSVLDVMLRAPGKWEPEAQHILDLLLRRVGPVLLGLGGALRCYVKSNLKNTLNDYRHPSQETFLRAVSVLGILLDAFGKRKERYMNESAFLVGRLFSLADNLHKSYCVVVRDGSLPPSLIGNSMLAKAFDNPQMAVADLADRMRIYVGWAQTASEPSENDPKKESKIIAVRNARETLNLYKPLADKLHQTGLSDRCDDIMKAEVLLGYLAS
ncbi:MAG: hypothetical protein PHH26_05155 [Candidatus Thermoplasmatota archaeon]|nr:hypothetical protein [Candidatus Thermoplasmatota archaeon]